MTSEEELHKGFRLGEWEILPARGILRCGDREERPEPLVFKVLLALASRNGDLVTRDELIDEVWDGRPIGDEPINRCVALLRGHLGDRNRPHKYIETLTRRGYRLSQDVCLIDPDIPVPEARKRAEKVWNQGRLWMVVAAVAVTILIVMVVRIGPQFDAVRSIGVLPLENLSGDPADQYLVSGFKVELVHTLHNIPKVAVIPAHNSYPDKEAGEIADLLGVDAVLFGEMQRVRDTLKITYRVERGDDGKVVSSGEISGDVQEIFALQGKLAVLVRNDLVGESPQQLISNNRNPNSDAFDRYIRGLDALERRGRGRPDNLAAAIALFEEAIQLDPGFAPAYLSLATAYALLPDYQNAPLEESHDRALEIINRGIAVDGSLADAAGEVEGFVYHKQKQWQKAEEAYRRATTARVVDSNAFNWYSLMLSGVGRLDDALEQILIAQKIDPGSTVINARLGMVYTWLGDSQKAAEFFDRVSLLDASEEIHKLGRTLLLIRQGKLGDAASVFGAGVSTAGGATEWIGPVFAAIEDPSKQSAALAAIENASGDPQMDPRFNIIGRTILGDTDGAMQAALLLADSDGFFEMDFLFMPELRPLREHADFLLLMDKLGIQHYWNASGCLWRNDKVSC